MKVDINELHRILDDFQTKADLYHQEAKELYRRGEYGATIAHDRQAHAFEYCAAILKQVLPNG